MGLTRYEIRIKLNDLYNERTGYNNKLSAYNESLRYANKLVGSLKNSKNNLNSVLDNLKKSFKINGKTGDNGKTNETITGIEGVLNDLEKKIIPSINEQIGELNTNIWNTNYNIRYWEEELKKAKS